MLVEVEQNPLIEVTDLVEINNSLRHYKGKLGFRTAEENLDSTKIVPASEVIQRTCRAVDELNTSIYTSSNIDQVLEAMSSFYREFLGEIRPFYEKNKETLEQAFNQLLKPYNFQIKDFTPLRGINFDLNSEKEQTSKQIKKAIKTQLTRPLAKAPLRVMRYGEDHV